MPKPEAVSLDRRKRDRSRPDQGTDAPNRRFSPLPGGVAGQLGERTALYGAALPVAMPGAAIRPGRGVRPAKDGIAGPFAMRIPSETFDERVRP